MLQIRFQSLKLSLIMSHQQFVCLSGRKIAMVINVLYFEKTTYPNPTWPRRDQQLDPERVTEVKGAPGSTSHSVEDEEK